MNGWQHQLNLAGVFHNEELTFAERRDAIVRRIKAARFYSDADWALTDTIEALADAEDVQEFDAIWNDFYDWADDQRVWVKTR